MLLDEIEKAHPDVFNLLLQVMDHGTLTDNNGRKADFRNVILIMTTNAGAQRWPARHRLHRAGSQFRWDGSNQKSLHPEFRNRLDSIIQFGSLSPETIRTVVDKFLVDLQVQLDEKGVVLHVEESARDWFVEHGYSESMGAGRWVVSSRRNSRKRWRKTSCLASSQKGRRFRNRCRFD